MQRVMAARGANTRYGRAFAARLRAQGLVDIQAQARMTMWQGGSAGVRLFRANFEQLREELVLRTHDGVDEQKSLRSLTALRRPGSHIGQPLRVR